MLESKINWLCARSTLTSPNPSLKTTGNRNGPPLGSNGCPDGGKSSGSSSTRKSPTNNPASATTLLAEPPVALPDPSDAWILIVDWTAGRLIAVRIASATCDLTETSGHGNADVSRCHIRCWAEIKFESYRSHTITQGKRIAVGDLTDVRRDNRCRLCRLSRVGIKRVGQIQPVRADTSTKGVACSVPGRISNWYSPADEVPPATLKD